MTRSLWLCSLLTVVGCSQDKAPGKAAPAPAPAPAAAAAMDPAPVAALDRMDLRKAIPMLPMMANHQKQNMRDHLAAVQGIVTALAADDLAAAGTAAKQLGSSPEMGAMCTHMGAAAPGFTEQALAFHQTADGIATAAAAGDKAGVIDALGKTLAACTGCHTTWKQQVVDQATYDRLAAAASAQPAPPAPPAP